MGVGHLVSGALTGYSASLVMPADKRNELYRRLAQMRPAFAGYETRTDRVIPMFRLSRAQEAIFSPAAPWRP